MHRLKNLLVFSKQDSAFGKQSPEYSHMTGLRHVPRNNILNIIYMYLTVSRSRLQVATK